MVEGKPIDHSRRDVGAAVEDATAQALATGANLPARHGCQRVFVAANRSLVDNRADVGLAVGRVPDDQFLRALGETLHELVVDRFLDVDAGAGRALLTGIAEGRAGDAFDSLVQVGVAGDDGWVLASKFGDARFGKVGREFLVEFPAYLPRAGEDDAVDVRVVGQGIADRLTGATDVVEDASRDTRIGVDARQLVAG